VQELTVEEHRGGARVAGAQRMLHVNPRVSHRCAAVECTAKGDMLIRGPRRQRTNREAHRRGTIVAQWIAGEESVEQRARTRGITGGEREPRRVEPFSRRGEGGEGASRVSGEQERERPRDGGAAGGRRRYPIKQLRRARGIARDARLPHAAPGVDARELAAGARCGECNCGAVGPSAGTAERLTAVTVSRAAGRAENRSATRG